MALSFPYDMYRGADAKMTDQALALYELYASTKMYSRTSRSKQNWFEQTDVCNFTGVTCDNDGYVDSIRLINKFLSGTLPDNFDKYPSLSLLVLNENDIGGTIPPTLINVSSMRVLNLGHNWITGQLPSFARMSSLKHLILDNNLFSGRLQSSLCQFQDLRTLDVSGNVKIRGTIPACLGNLTNIETLSITDTSITGEVPQALCEKPNFNGLEPNTFGCDAIACPAGTYQERGGRQRSNETKCQPCTQPSLTIGATQCIIDAMNPDTIAPSTTPGTSAVPSYALVPPPLIFLPTQKPSHKATLQPSLLSTIDTNIPTDSTVSTFRPSHVMDNNNNDDQSGDSSTTSPTATPYNTFSQAPSYLPTLPLITPGVIGVIDDSNSVQSRKYQGGTISGIAISSLFGLVFILLILKARRLKKSTYKDLQKDGQQLEKEDDVSDTIVPPLAHASTYLNDIPEDAPAPSRKSTAYLFAALQPPSSLNNNTLIRRKPSLKQQSLARKMEGKNDRKVRFSLPEESQTQVKKQYTAIVDPPVTVPTRAQGTVGQDAWMYWLLNPVLNKVSNACSTNTLLPTSLHSDIESNADDEISTDDSATPILPQTPLPLPEFSTRNIYSSQSQSIDRGSRPRQLGIGSRVQATTSSIMLLEQVQAKILPATRPYNERVDQKLPPSLLDKVFEASISDDSSLERPLVNLASEGTRNFRLQVQPEPEPRRKTSGRREYRFDNAELKADDVVEI